MPEQDPVRRYLEVGVALGRLAIARAEELVREVLGDEEPRGGDVRQQVDELVGRGRRATKDAAGVVRREVASQLAALGLDPEHLAEQVADLLRRAGAAGDAGCAPRDARAEHGGGVGTTGGNRAATKSSGKKAPDKAKAPKKAQTKKKAGSKPSTDAGSEERKNSNKKPATEDVPGGSSTRRASASGARRSPARGV